MSTQAPASAPPVVTADTVQQSNDRTAGAVLAGIAGREREPASQVFKNVTLHSFKTRLREHSSRS